MNWRWLMFDYVDPALGLSREERSAIRRTMRSLGWRTRNDMPASIRPPLWIDLATSMAPAVIMLIVMTPVFIFSLSLRVLPVMLAVQIALSWLVMSFLGRWCWRPRAWWALREHGYDVCLSCGHWLRGLAESSLRCPECGASRELHQA